jgi:outer membrane receptor for monomeric catechols
MVPSLNLFCFIQTGSHAIELYACSGSSISFRARTSSTSWGDDTNFRQGAGQFQNVRTTEFSLFVQDNWRVTQRLALNLGVRWDPFGPYQEIKTRVAKIWQCSGISSLI